MPASLTETSTYSSFKDDKRNGHSVPNQLGGQQHLQLSISSGVGADEKSQPKVDRMLVEHTEYARTAVDRSMTSREGRAKNRFNPVTGARLAAGVVALSPDKSRVLMVSTLKKYPSWVVPKGGWETDETVQQAALREGWEEGGIVGHITCSLGCFKDKRPADTLDRRKKYLVQHQQLVRDGTLNASEALKPIVLPPRAECEFFEVVVERLENKYPEMHKRCRRWMTYSEAREALNARSDLLAALEQSSIDKSA